MNMALAGIAGVTDSPPHRADQSKFPAANVLSLQARRDLRQSVMDGKRGLRVESHRDTMRLKLLLDLVGDSVSNQELRGLVRAMMMRVKSATDSDSVCILLQRQEEGDLDLYALDSKSEGTDFKERTVIPLVGTIAGNVLKMGKPWVGTREQACAIFPNDRLLKEQFSTGCMLPLPGHNRFVGTLGLVRAQHSPYSQDEVDFLIAVSSQVAIALQNALASQDISQLKEKLAQEK
ncbi:MAG TPA: GAF domain-containing protein, partial [Pyrinomonadaceae bacterium]